MDLQNLHPFHAFSTPAGTGFSYPFSSWQQQLESVVSRHHQQQLLHQEAMNHVHRVANSSFLIENLLGLNQRSVHHPNHRSFATKIPESPVKHSSRSSPSSQSCLVSSTSLMLPRSSLMENIGNNSNQLNKPGHLRLKHLSSNLKRNRLPFDSLNKSKGKDLKPSSASSSKNKRIRTIFTQDQLDKLEIEFEKSQYMVGAERDELAKLLFLSPNQVKVWFQNRRIKYRKQHQEETQRKLAATRATAGSNATAVILPGHHDHHHLPCHTNASITSGPSDVDADDFGSLDGVEDNSPSFPISFSSVLAFTQ